MDIILIAASWLHLLATVTLIGLYLVMAFAVTPAAIAAPAHAGLVLEAYRRAKAPALIGWLLFIVSGVTLTLIDPQYAGLGRFDSPWAILMLVKHLLVLVMILLSGMITLCPVIGLRRPLESAVAGQAEVQALAVLRRINGRERITALLGIVILLLTASAEVV